MKKGPTKVYNTDNTMETLVSHERDLLGTRATQSINQHAMTLNMNSVDTHITTSNIDSAHEKRVPKQIKKVDSLKGTDINQMKISNYIREVFLDIRQKTIDEVIFHCIENFIQVSFE